jgi:NAD(P)-dependent dehydrogenase (short-subunit alcohol dehydrogenase family)
MVDLTGLTILVTGAGSGIGRESVRLFSELGATLILVGRRLEALQETLPTARLVVLDHADAESVRAFALECPPLDGMFLNAGQFESGFVATTPPEQFDRMLAANLRGPWLLSHFLGPKLKDGARVVLTGSNIGIRAIADTAAYSVAKAGVHMLTQILAKEWGPRGIRCNAIAPGPVPTDMLRLRFNDPGVVDQELEALKDVNPMHRLGTGKDIASLAAYLLSLDNSWTSGAVIPVDGGATAVF